MKNDMDYFKALEEADYRQFVEYFVKESWRIEQIFPTEAELAQVKADHLWFLDRKRLTLANVMKLAARFGSRNLIRDRFDMNVRVGRHIAPQGGPNITSALQSLLMEIEGGLSAFEGHRRFERLHPFMDGNGRTGRAIWLWTHKRNLNPQSFMVLLRRGFLHSWYYETLDNSEQ